MLCPLLNLISLIDTSWPRSMPASPTRSRIASTDSALFFMDVIDFWVPTAGSGCEAWSPQPCSLLDLVRVQLLARGHHGFIVVLREVRPRHPGKGHFIERPLAVAPPVPRVGVGSVGGRVVVPQNRVQHGARRV